MEKRVSEVTCFFDENDVQVYKYRDKPYVGLVMPDALHHPESSVFDIDDFGPFLTMYVDTPGEALLHEMRHCRKEVRLVRIGNAMWFTFKFGDNPWFDAPYTPCLSMDLDMTVNVKNYGKLAELLANIMVVLIDTSNATVEYVCDMPLNEKFANSFFRIFKHHLKEFAIKNQADYAKYQAFIADTKREVSPSEIAVATLVRYPDMVSVVYE